MYMKKKYSRLAVGPRAQPTSRHGALSTKGFSLIEALVALVVFAMGMTGIAHMLLLTHKSNASNYLRQQAIQAAYNITDRIRANRNAAINGNYNVSNIVTSGTPTMPGTPATNCGTTTCSANQLATYDTWYWLTTTVAQLPNGCGSITTAPSGTNTVITVTVQWSDSPTQQFLGATNPSSEQFSIKTQL
jgi:type IV pilus assembly protein PilV